MIVKISKLKFGRRTFKNKNLEELKKFVELAEDIQKNGIKEPLVVQRQSWQDGYYVLDGIERWQAAIVIGLEEIPVRCIE